MKWETMADCNMKIYQPKEIYDCFSQYGSVQVLGDSRARQIFTALRSIINDTDNPLVMFDNKYHGLNRWHNQVITANSDIRLHQLYIKYYHDLVEFLKGRHLPNGKYVEIEQPKLIILPSIILPFLSVADFLENTVVWTEIGSGGTFYVAQASWIELEERILDMYIC